MNAWLLDVEKFIKVNNLQPVTNPINFDRGNVPSEDGLFSTQIFGTSSSERKVNFSYIDLYKPFLNPKAYIALKRVDRNFESVVYGTKRFKIEDGQLVVDDNGETGLDWLYKNWEKFKFKKNNSEIRSRRVDVLLNNPKNVVFMKYQVVIPAFYRDVNLQSSGKPSFITINNLYSKIMRNVVQLREANTFDFMLNTITGKTQDLIIDVYNELKTKIGGKNGYLRKFLMGRSVDYACRLVITAVPYDKKNLEDQTIDYYYTGVPLAYTCGMFTPFIIYWVRRFFETRLDAQKTQFPVNTPDGKIIHVKLEDPAIYFNEEYISKRLARFIKTPSSRFDTIEIPVLQSEMDKYNLKERPKLGFVGYPSMMSTVNPTDENAIKRPMTWTDIFYMAAIDVTSDKHIYITRYPMLDYLGTCTTRITVLSTRDTMPVVVNDKLYKNYPVIELDKKGQNLDILFRDTLSISALYLSGMGADFDGDQTTIKGVFSQEANEECERILQSKTNVVAINGSPIRKIGNEGVQTLFSMTRFR